MQTDRPIQTAAEDRSSGLSQPSETINLQRFLEVSNWVQGLDLSQRPSGYEPDAKA